MSTRDFLVGFISGILVAGILARAFQDYLVGRSPVQLFFRPQRVVLPTKETPASVLGSCISTIIQWLVVLVLLIGAAIVLWGMWTSMR